MILTLALTYKSHLIFIFLITILLALLKIIMTFKINNFKIQIFNEKEENPGCQLKVKRYFYNNIIKENQQ